VDYSNNVACLVVAGDVVKGWKTRFFCARNQSDNYSIDYFENESCAKKKGTILCCGHRAEEFSPEEEEMHGKYGIKISAEDDDSRIWWLRCESEDDKADWLKHFMNACQKALPPSHPDPVIVTAFHATYKALRWKYGFMGWYRSSYTENELLARLCSDLIAKEITQRTYSDTTPGNQRAAAMKQAQKSVDNAVVDAANRTWTAALARCSPQREALETQVRAAKDLPDHEAQLAASISNLTADVVDPFLQDAKQRVCRSVLHSCESPITNSFVTSIHGFHDYMAEQIREESFTKKCFQKNIVASHRSVEEWWAGPLEDTNQVCWAMYTNDLTDISSFYVAGYSAYNLYSEVLDSNRKLMHRALSLFAKMSTDSNFLNLEKILKKVLQYVIHDAKIYLKAVLSNILFGFLQSSFEADVVVHCLELVEPLEKFIVECPSPDVRDLLSLAGCTENVLWQRLRDEITDVVAASHDDNCAEIDTTSSLVGTDALL
jgi:hypothetical protein